MDERRDTIRRIEAAIGDGKLIWVGTRGTDAQPLLHIAQFAGVFGLIAPLGVPSWQDGSESYLENMSGERVDLNAYSIDEDNSIHVAQLARQLRGSLVPGSLVIAYRPSAFLSSAYYPRMEHATYHGVFHGSQAAYEHKPWVETEMSKRSVPIIPWRYFADDDSAVMLEWMEGRDCVVRANYSDGGAGLALVRRHEDGFTELPGHSDGFLAVAPLLDPSVPLNVSGCVFRDGNVTVRHPSLQLIGIETCTTRRFGYCGNDFAAAWEAVGRDNLEQLEAITRQAGRWLGESGYVGAFGLDALLYGDEVCLTEINPRFQGSSAAAASIACELGWSDVYLDHLTAHLDLASPPQAPLWEQAYAQAADGSRMSQIISYNCGPAQRLRENAFVPDLHYGDLKGIAPDGVRVMTDAMMFKLLVRDRVTDTGFDIPDWLADDIAGFSERLYEPDDSRLASLPSDATET